MIFAPEDAEAQRIFLARWSERQGIGAALGIIHPPFKLVEPGHCLVDPFAGEEGAQAHAVFRALQPGGDGRLAAAGLAIASEAYPITFVRVKKLPLSECPHPINGTEDPENDHDKLFTFTTQPTP